MFQSAPSRHGKGPTGCTAGVNWVVPIGMLVTPAALALWRKKRTSGLPLPDIMNRMVSPGAPDRGQAYPSSVAAGCSVPLLLLIQSEPLLW